MRALALALLLASACASPEALVRDSRTALDAVQAPVDRAMPKLAAVDRVLIAACGPNPLAWDGLCRDLLPLFQDFQDDFLDAADALDQADRAVSALEGLVGP